MNPGGEHAAAEVAGDGAAALMDVIRAPSLTARDEQ